MYDIIYMYHHSNYTHIYMVYLPLCIIIVSFLMDVWMYI